ncbi:MAG: YaiI/YqxD family protein [Deltaproteobacteria bacterium]|nr:MAG: YaiI/YqxD family protein [Deltaproteobacteria bacterium]
MRTIYIDADGCPVKDEVYKVARRYGWRVFVVANTPIHTPSQPRLFTIQVGDGPDVADDYIAERAGAGDIVVSTDIPLAARVLPHGARVVTFKGHERTAADIGDALAGRELSQNLREAGVMTGGPAPMTARDRSRVLERLDLLVNTIAREHDA